MAYFVVTTPVDVVDPGDGRLSLREAIARANATPAADTVRFVAALAGDTLVLSGGELTIRNDLTIDGGNGARVTIDGDDKSRVLRVQGGGTDVSLRNLGVTGGYGDYDGGAGIRLAPGSGLSLSGCDVSGNRHGYDVGYGDGGGILAAANNRVSIVDTTMVGNRGAEGGALTVLDGGRLIITGSLIDDNLGLGINFGVGGGLRIADSTADISRTTISHNLAPFGGGISASRSIVRLTDSTLAANAAEYRLGYSDGGAIEAYGGTLTIVNSTITGNRVLENSQSDGGGIAVSSGTLFVLNSIVAGNFQRDFPNPPGPADDISGPVTLSNGRNVFGSAVAGSVPGDRAHVAPATVFASIDPATGGGRLRADGIVALRNDRANPALSAGDPLAATIFDQRGAARPQPAGSLPDLGAVELDQPLSTGASANNDVVSGSAAANSLSGRAGNDYLKGLAGNDTMDGGPGGDLLDGGPGNDKLAGGPGPDLVAYPGAAAVIIDLGGTTDTARRGGEKDTLIGIEGALGSSGADRFTGDALANEFQGKAGKDTMTGGGGRDSWDFNDTADSPAGAMRDLVTDFAPGQDVIDLAGVDADATVPGNQGFRWVAKATLTGAAQLGWFATGGMTIVRASTDGDAAPELEIQLTGSKTLSEGDFRP